MRRLAPLFLCAWLPLMPVQAQAPEQRTRLIGLTFDHWDGDFGAAILRPTFRLTTYAPRGPGVEFAAVMFPDGISLQPPGLSFGLQAGLAQPVTVGPATFLLKAGGAGIAVAGLLADNELFRLVPGIQAGLGVLLPMDRKSTLRLDVTRHVYQPFGARSGVWSVGVGFAGAVRR